MNLFRDSRTMLDSIRDKLVTLIYLALFNARVLGRHSTVRVVRGMVTHELRPARDLRLPQKASGSAMSADRQTLEVFVIVKVLFWIPQQLIIVKIRK